MTQNHWEEVYTNKAADEVSWFETSAQMSLSLMADLTLAQSAPLIDVGGGASSLVDDWLSLGFTDVTVLDIAAPALVQSQARLAERTSWVTWLIADVLMIDLPMAHYQLWHDRAVFHFLTEASQRARYRERLVRALSDDGYFVIGTFADDGPMQCSGLPVCRYSLDTLAAEFSEDFRLLRADKQLHVTPWGSEQSFVFGLFAKK